MFCLLWSIQKCSIRLASPLYEYSQWCLIVFGIFCTHGIHVLSLPKNFGASGEFNVLSRAGEKNEREEKKIEEEVNTNFLFNSSLSQMKQKTKERTELHAQRKQTNNESNWKQLYHE